MVEATGASQSAAAATGGNGDNADGGTGPKHTELADEAHEGVVLIENKFTRNLTSPFINQKKAWDDEDEMTNISAEM